LEALREGLEGPFFLPGRNRRVASQEELVLSVSDVGSNAFYLTTWGCDGSRVRNVGSVGVRVSVRGALVALMVMGWKLDVEAFASRS
jgi:hypothetical protein